MRRLKSDGARSCGELYFAAGICEERSVIVFSLNINYDRLVLKVRGERQSVKIMDGVNLTLKPTKKYKTNRILVSFATNITDPREITARTLLADLLESSSKNLATQRAVALKLSELYGASFGTSVSRYGNVYGLNFIINVVNDKYLAGESNILMETFKFLREMIFAPQIVDKQFVADIFQIQKQNLTEFLLSLDDNKQRKALASMNALYFHEQSQRIPTVGQATDVSGLTAINMAEYYNKMVLNDQVNIVISGDLDETEVRKAVGILPFTARENKQLDLIYSQAEVKDVKFQDDKESVSQSKLNLAYRLPVEFNSHERYAALVFNELFGGSALSLLFQNVREKNSLAYYAESDLDLFRQEMWVQTGIQSENKDQVLLMIKEQLKQLRAGQVDEKLLQKIKTGLINSYISRSDSQNTALSRGLSAGLTGVTTPEDQWIAGIKAVHSTEISAVASIAQLQAVYFLNGGSK